MKSLLLKYSDRFAPPEGTIAAHEKMIDACGYVWYGKFGLKVSEKRIREILQQDNPYILLYNGATDTVFIAYIADYATTTPLEGGIPDYYKDKYAEIKSWFKIMKFERYAGSLRKFRISSSKEPLIRTKKASMSSFFYIEEDRNRGLNPKENNTDPGPDFIGDYECESWLMEDLSEYNDIIDSFDKA